jgi:hypothetical protein
LVQAVAVFKLTHGEHLSTTAAAAVAPGYGNA